MARWECAIEGDDAAFDRVEDLMVHQAAEHDCFECMVCGAVVPDGYFVFRHAFDEPSRAEYVRAYAATAAVLMLAATVATGVGLLKNVPPAGRQPPV
jgi:hypothetical protein